MKKYFLTLIVAGAVCVLVPSAAHAQQSVSTSQTSTVSGTDPNTGQPTTTIRSDAHSMNCNGMGGTATTAQHKSAVSTVNPDGSVSNSDNKQTKTTTVTRTPNGVQETEGTTSQTNSSTTPPQQ